MPPIIKQTKEKIMATIQSENRVVFGVDYAQKIGPNAALERTPDGIGMMPQTPDNPDATDYPWRIQIAFENGSYYTYLTNGDLAAVAAFTTEGVTMSTETDPALYRSPAEMRRRETIKEHSDEIRALLNGDERIEITARGGCATYPDKDRR